MLAGNPLTTLTGPAAFQPPQANVGSAPTSVAIADVNGDGIPDLVAANNGNNT